MADPKIMAITGVTGFLGRHLVPALLGAGYHVRALVRNPSKLPQDWLNYTEFTVVEGDLNSDLSHFVQGADRVIHMAGLIKAQTRSEFMAVNAQGAANVAKSAQAANVPRFILLSSMAAREPHLSDYAASKAEGEAAAQENFRSELSIIRAPAVFGPGDEATKPIFDLMSKGYLPVLGRDWKKYELSMVYVKDLVQFIITQVEANALPAKPVEPCTVEAMTWQGFAVLCAEAIGRPVRVLPIPRPIIIPIAAITSLTSRVLGKGHLTLQKLAEFRHPDWTSGTLVDNPTPMVMALRETAASYRPKKQE